MHPMFPRLCVDAVLVSASELLERGSLSRAREVFGAVSIGKLEPEQRVLLADQRLRLASLSGDAQGATRALTDVGPLLSEWQNGFWSARLALVERRPVRAVSLLLTACDRAPSEALSDVLLTLGSALYETGDFDGATARYQQAAAVAMERGEPSAALSAWVRLGAACLERGEFEQSRRFLEQAVGRRAELGDVREIGVALSNLGVVAHETGELGEATQLLDDAVSLLRKVEHRRFEGFALAARGLVALETGLTRKAARDLHLARRALVEVADPTYVAVVDARLGVLSWTLGAQDAAFEHLNCAALAFDARSITWGALGVRAVSARLKDGHWPDERPDSSFVRLLGRVIDNSDSINASG
jgi:tetratricopeptide (TPR) repeat protein